MTNVKILVGYHEPAPLIKSEIFIPVNGGRALLASKLETNKISKWEFDWLQKNTTGDDTGENISLKNSTYNEMSILYWAWKNYNKVGNPEYIGFMHYRRHFVLNDDIARTSNQWTCNFENVGCNIEDYLNKISLTRTSVNNILTKNDCIVAAANSIDVYNQYKKSLGHRITDLEYCLDFISKNLPKYKDAATHYMSSKTQYFCNMFIMKRELFFEYCSFIFPILDSFVKNIDFSDASAWEKRLFISERLTGIFIQYLKENNVAVYDAKVSLITNTSIEAPVLPIYGKNNIPIVFTVDNKYLPYLHVTLTSLLLNSSPDNNYEINILHQGLSQGDIKKFRASLPKKNNFSCRFIDIRPYIQNIDLSIFYIEIHVSLSTYFRFFIQEIFKEYKKVLYIDCDTVILDDVAKLYNIDIGNNWLGAARDIREGLSCKLNLTVSGRKWRDYVINTLACTDHYDYFQAGVLLFNVQEMRSNNVKEKLFQALSEIKTPILSDQDILNSVCYKHVFFFDERWNIEWQIPIEFPEYSKLLSETSNKLYEKAISAPGIIHYASSVKPWHHPDYPNAWLWWKYAREGAYYESFLEQILNRKGNAIHAKRISKFKRLRNSVKKAFKKLKG